MGDEQRSGVRRTEHDGEFGGQSVMQFAVKSRERLVEQQHCRARGQRPGQRHSLRLTPTQLRHVEIRQGFETDQMQQLLHSLGGLGASDTLHTQPEADVFRDRQVREQLLVLKHEADVAPM